jgi:hypothetical protein
MTTAVPDIYDRVATLTNRFFAVGADSPLPEQFIAAVTVACMLLEEVPGPRHPDIDTFIKIGKQVTAELLIKSQQQRES